MRYDHRQVWPGVASACCTAEQRSDPKQKEEIAMSEGRTIVDLVLRGVGMAMGVAVVVLSILDAANTNTSIILLGIGLFALGLDALNRGG
jgi:hypothetical protein